MADPCPVAGTSGSRKRQDPQHFDSDSDSDINSDSDSDDVTLSDSDLGHGRGLKTKYNKIQTRPNKGRHRDAKKARYSPENKDKYLIKLQSSNITLDDIKKYFPGITYSEYPTNSSIGEELQGSNDHDVLQNLLDDLKEKQFPISVSTVEHLLRSVASSDSEELIRNVEENCTKPVTDVLSKVKFLSKSSRQLVDSYRQIQIKLSEARMKYNSLTVGKIVIQHLSDYVTSALRANDSTHDALVKFWSFILSTFQIDDQTSHVTTRVCTNGSGKKLFIRMKTAKPSDPKTVKSMKVYTSCTSGGDTPEEEEDLVKLVIESKPDVIFERTQYIEWADNLPVDLQLPEELTRCFIVEVKTTAQGFGLGKNALSPTYNQCNPSGSCSETKHNWLSDGQSTRGRAKTRTRARSADNASSSNQNVAGFAKFQGGQLNKRSSSAGRARSGGRRRSCSGSHSESQIKKSSDTEKPWRPGSPENSSNTVNIPMAPRLESLRTQHFIELLSTLKSEDLEHQSLVHQINAVGFYVVMHRVYVTGLHVNAPRGTSGVTKKSYIDIANCESLKNQKRKNFHMICGKWFNLLKAEHFKALIKFIQYLVCCHPKDLINLS